MTVETGEEGFNYIRYFKVSVKNGTITLGKQKWDGIIKTYNEMEYGSYYHPNVEKIASGLNGQSLQYIKDVELHNAILKARKKEIHKNELSDVDTKAALEALSGNKSLI